jgi:hypothetical protein
MKPSRPSDSAVSHPHLELFSPAASEAIAPTLVSRMRTSHVRLLLTACLATVGAVVSPLGTGVAVAQPTANFEWAPKPVVAGTKVTFTSTSTPTDATATITRIAWNLDGQPGLEIRPTAADSTVTATAPAAGAWRGGPSRLGQHWRQRLGVKDDHRPGPSSSAATSASAASTASA